MRQISTSTYSMTDASPTSGIDHGYNSPEREETDCDRCGEEKVVAFVDRNHPALCEDCEEYVASLDVPDDGRELTPMDKRWR